MASQKDTGREGGENQHPVLVRSRRSLEKTVLTLIPASLPSLDTENCPPVTALQQDQSLG